MKSKLNIPERKMIMVFGDLFIISGWLWFYFSTVVDSNFVSLVFVTIVSMIGLFTYFFLAYVLDFYYLQSSTIRSTGTIIKGVLIASFFTTIVVLFSVIIFDVSFWRSYLTIFFLFCSPLLFLWRRIYFYIFKFIPTTKKVFFLYESNLNPDYDFQKNIKTINGFGLDTHYNVVKEQDLSKYNEKTVCDFRQESNKIDTWVIDVDLSKRMPKMIEDLMLQSMVDGTEVLTLTSFYTNVYEALPIISHNANQSCAEILQLQHNKVRYLSSIFSFSTNLLLSVGVGLILLLVIPFVFLLNMLFNKGPLFYTQKRVGQNGKEFDIYKFRSMIVNAEKSGAKMAAKNDTRVTPFGKILRMFRIDELPQIISVIKGDMLFIGPRPERKVFVDELNNILPFYNVRHLVKPGITGWAQVKYKYGENLEDSIKKLEYDLYYIKKKSIALDLRIVFKTFTTVIFSRGI